jgi:hypothetical protein
MKSDGWSTPDPSVFPVCSVLKRYFRMNTAPVRSAELARAAAGFPALRRDASTPHGNRAQFTPDTETGAFRQAKLPTFTASGGSMPAIKTPVEVRTQGIPA